MSKEIVEINGVKFEVDLTQAKKVQEFRVGDSVKVLVKEYSNSYSTKLGTVVGFDWFDSLPTVRIAYLDKDYSSCKIKFIDYNEKTVDVEISPLNNVNELSYSKQTVIEAFDMEVTKKRMELDDVMNQRDLFVRTFAKYFEEATSE